MGLFHCPVGAAYYDDEDCIKCGLCLATTREEMVIASEKIRVYLKSNANKSSAMKKIAVCGKGGVGKSTTVMLLARGFQEFGYEVTVLDTDESNPGLFRMFGFENAPKPLLTLLERFSLETNDADAQWIKSDIINMRDIPLEYTVNKDGLKFLMVGKIEDPFQGCACTMADITRELMSKIDIGDKQVILIDMEAGVESFGRGVERNVDTVLVIVEPSFESMVLAEKIQYMATGMGINRVRVILNKVSSDQQRQKMIERLGQTNINVIGTVYYDKQISEASFDGRPPDDSTAQENVKEIINKILAEAS